MFMVKKSLTLYDLFDDGNSYSCLSKSSWFIHTSVRVSLVLRQ